ncbi:hypothetical protein TNCT_471981 [Trichonephila clavata]|uniref:Uncharacterized protein n=1 Tax=Trichonephila clavata TaxID=2740835 RepID=A0A8X6L8H5_TRICU|nr:hypothetical protein TNCT_471981 [Trichonephila clavata]
MRTIEKLPQENCSSNNSFDKGGAGIFFFFPQDREQEHIFNTGLIAFNFTGDLLAIRETLTMYLTYSPAMNNLEGLIRLSDSKSALEAIINGDLKRKERKAFQLFKSDETVFSQFI